MGELRDEASKKVDASRMLAALNKVPSDKRAKYKEAIRYLDYYYDNLVTGSEIKKIVDPRINGRAAQVSDFSTTFLTVEERRYDPNNPLTLEYGDHIYGTDDARSLERYSKTNAGQKPWLEALNEKAFWTPPYKPARMCDDFNNVVGIGQGEAFGMKEPGSPLGTRESALAQIRAKMSGQTALDPTLMSSYQNTLLNSRYDPATAFDVSKDDLRKDKVKSKSKSLNPFRKKAENVMHARWYRAIRRACKGGIVMVATQQNFKQANAKILFILDRMGDLGTAAYKIALKDKGGDTCRSLPPNFLSVFATGTIRRCPSATS